MNAIDFARAVRAGEEGHERRTPLVTPTGYDDRGTHEACLAAAVDEILEKPVDGDTLAAVRSRGTAPT